MVAIDHRLAVVALKKLLTVSPDVAVGVGEIALGFGSGCAIGLGGQASPGHLIRFQWGDVLITAPFLASAVLSIQPESRESSDNASQWPTLGQGDLLKRSPTPFQNRAAGYHHRTKSRLSQLRLMPSPESGHG